jgi:hypothetical protein
MLKLVGLTWAQAAAFPTSTSRRHRRAHLQRSDLAADTAAHCERQPSRALTAAHQAGQGEHPPVVAMVAVGVQLVLAFVQAGD